MKRSAVPSIALIAAAALVALLVYGVAIKGTSHTLDNAVHDGKLPQLPGATMKMQRLGDDGSASISDYRGKVVVVNIWASWCTPCEGEAPLLQRTQAKLAGKGVTVLGVTYNDIPRESLGFVNRYHYTFPSIRDVGAKFYKDVGSTGVPETFVLDARGRVVALNRGQIDQKFLDAAIAKAKASV